MSDASEPVVSLPSGDEVAPVAGMRIAHGSPTPEEIAAVTAVLHAAQHAAEERGRAAVRDVPRAGWDAGARGLRTPLVRGDGAWSRSLR